MDGIATEQITYMQKETANLEHSKENSPLWKLHRMKHNVHNWGEMIQMNHLC